MTITQVRRSRAIYSELCCSQGVDHHQVHSAESQRQAGEWKNCVVKKGKASGKPWEEVVGILCDWFGEQIWLSLLGPELEARANMREVGSHDLVKSWLFWASSCRGFGLASWSDCGGSDICSAHCLPVFSIPAIFAVFHLSPIIIPWER